MSDQRLKAFDFASESTRLLITLSTGFIALTITFSKEFIGDVTQVPIWPLALAWLLFFLSIMFGILTMLSLTGSLSEDATSKEAPGKKGGKLSIYSPNITYMSILQILFFLAAVLFTGIFGLLSL
ncbi:hypothetical protein [Flavilitoribacter nigricans]|uniref:Uncharacterized protein n=1 Tax=Flavilitoribacter nigricans (strain ATCC 23147 / DSM 23189 / NBRC 102662 / NCIMB 1420 / SS-2) TaxID=1122177 RepID=A0A2D0MXI8_FLAN2|nr:hypothetical protein [Flavilitoribacter nigricans]PHN00858.1 hypothetical protein CRP01_40190 [Flavilitoribacter nigricans DSM 23189 = NBRC 102662]